MGACRNRKALPLTRRAAWLSQRRSIRARFSNILQDERAPRRRFESRLLCVSWVSRSSFAPDVLHEKSAPGRIPRALGSNSESRYEGTNSKRQRDIDSRAARGS